jgi:hypothetical protein
MNTKLIHRRGAEALRFIFAVITLLALLCVSASPRLTAAEAKPSILSQVSVSAVGAVHQAEFTGGPTEYGAGLDIGLPINPFVSIHVRHLAFEGAGALWRDSGIDETSIYGRADFVKLAAEKFRIYGTGGGTRHWERDTWSFGLGLGAEYRFTKNIALSAGRELRAYFDDTRRDWLSTAAITFRF